MAETALYPSRTNQAPSLAFRLLPPVVLVLQQVPLLSESVRFSTGMTTVIAIASVREIGILTDVPNDHVSKTVRGSRLVPHVRTRRIATKGYDTRKNVKHHVLRSVSEVSVSLLRVRLSLRGQRRLSGTPFRHVSEPRSVKSSGNTRTRHQVRYHTNLIWIRTRTTVAGWNKSSAKWVEVLIAEHLRPILIVSADVVSENSGNVSETGTSMVTLLWLALLPLTTLRHLHACQEATRIASKVPHLHPFAQDSLGSEVYWTSR